MSETESATGRQEECSDVVIGSDFVTTIKEAAEVLLRTAAEINNSITRIERHHPYADEVVLKNEIRHLRGTSTALSLHWAEMDLSLAIHDLL